MLTKQLTRRLGDNATIEVMNVPKFRTYAQEEAAVMQPRRGRSVDLSEYIVHLSGLSVGQVAEAALSEGEKKSTVKRRLTSAAKKLEKNLKYRRSSEAKVIFEIIE